MVPIHQIVMGFEHKKSDIKSSRDQCAVDHRVHFGTCAYWSPQTLQNQPLAWLLAEHLNGGRGITVSSSCECVIHS